MHGTLLRIQSAGRETLAGIVEEWRELAAAAGEANVFMEPMAALPALDFPGAQSVFALLAWGAEGNGRRRLDGMLLLKGWKRAPWLPRVVQSWNYRLRAFGEPLIRAGREEAFWRAMLPRLDALNGFSVLRLAQLDAESASTRALRAVADEEGRPLYETRSLERAALRGPLPAADYPLPGKVRREAKRRLKRLGDLGEVAFERLGAEEDAVPWVEELIALEAAGWKGRRGVAAASEPHVEAMVRAFLAEAHSAGRLDMRRMRVGGRTISMLAHVAQGRGAMSFKIAFDEAYARYAPGTALQLDWLETGLGLELVDSCATPGHAMFESLWLERRRIVTLMLPFDRVGARASLAAEMAARAWFGRR